MKNKKLFGFTLAEVLITLAIIGVVAALTLPTLMSNYRKKEVETKLVKFYATVNNALQMAEADHGQRENWEPVRPVCGVTKDEDNNFIEDASSIWAKKYLIPYINGTQKFEDRNGLVYIYLKDGSTFTVNCYAFGYYPRGIKFGEDGKETGTISGVNKFEFYYYPLKDDNKNFKYHGRGIELYKVEWNGNIEQLKRDAYYSCYTGSNPAYCSALIELNGWKIPNDYPYHF